MLTHSVGLTYYRVVRVCQITPMERERLSSRFFFVFFICETEIFEHT